MVGEHQVFSGVYKPDTDGSGQAEDFAASFLISKSRFIDSFPAIHGAKNMAGVSFAVVRFKPHNVLYRSLMSRDYFDFLVEHLSTTSNFIPKGNEMVFRVYTMRLKQTVARLKDIATTKPRWDADKRLNQTMVVLVYSSISFSRKQNAFQSKIRRAFFEATFWSLYRYTPFITIYVASDFDRATIRKVGLPAWRLTQLEVPLDERNRTVLLPRYSLEHAVKQLETDRIVSKKFKYVYFSEGDQILHMRHATGLFDTIDNSDGRFLLVPHRMQTMPLARTLRHNELRGAFARSNHLNMQNVSIVTENLEEAHGSCCDDGRFIVEDCGTWWYSCASWGLRDLSPWLQFGKSGYTFSTATAHKGSCRFHSEQIVCPMIEGCQNRVPPRNATTGAGATNKDICMELPKLTKLGPHHKPDNPF